MGGYLFLEETGSGTPAPLTSLAFRSPGTTLGIGYKKSASLGQTRMRISYVVAESLTILQFVAPLASVQDKSRAINLNFQARNYLIFNLS